MQESVHSQSVFHTREPEPDPVPSCHASLCCLFDFLDRVRAIVRPKKLIKMFSIDDASYSLQIRNRFDGMIIPRNWPSITFCILPYFKMFYQKHQWRNMRRL